MIGAASAAIASTARITHGQAPERDPWSVTVVPPLGISSVVIPRLPVVRKCVHKAAKHVTAVVTAIQFVAVCFSVFQSQHQRHRMLRPADQLLANREGGGRKSEWHRH